MSEYNPTGESEYYKRMRLAGEKRFDKEMHRRDFAKRFRPLLENGMSENEFLRGNDWVREGDTLSDFRELKAEMEREQAMDEAFLRGFNSVKGPYQRYEKVEPETVSEGAN